LSGAACIRWWPPGLDLSPRRARRIPRRLHFLSFPTAISCPRLLRAASGAACRPIHTNCASIPLPEESTTTASIRDERDREQRPSPVRPADVLSACPCTCLNRPVLLADSRSPGAALDACFRQRARRGMLLSQSGRLPPADDRTLAAAFGSWKEMREFIVPAGPGGSPPSPVNCRFTRQEIRCIPLNLPLRWKRRCSPPPRGPALRRRPDLLFPEKVRFASTRIARPAGVGLLPGNPAPWRGTSYFYSRSTPQSGPTPLISSVRSSPRIESPGPRARMPPKLARLSLSAGDRVFSATLYLVELTRSAFHCSLVTMLGPFLKGSWPFVDDEFERRVGCGFPGTSIVGEKEFASTRNVIAGVLRALYPA